jgi:hypothetical protein
LTPVILRVILGVAGMYGTNEGSSKEKR